MPSLALRGGTPVRTAPFPSWPVWDERELKNLQTVLESGTWGINSPLVGELECRFAGYVGSPFAISCTNGTAALYIATKAAGVGAGDEVIVPPYTFIATASSVLLANGIPVFVDIEPDTYNLDPTKIEAAITDRTKAIIAVHIGGRPADMDAIQEIARKHDLRVIEDCAQAHGAEWRGQRVGSIGDLGCFSFQSSKNITAGEGGIVTTSSESLFDLCFSYQNVGRVREGAWYEHRVLGTNNRMTAWQAAVLLAQMERAEEQTDRRDRNGAWLDRELGKIDGIAPLRPDDRITRQAYHLYIFRYLPEGFGGVPRSQFLAALQAEGIPCSSGYVPLYREDAFVIDTQDCPQFAGREIPYGKLQLPVCERACDEEGVWFTQNLLLGDPADLQSIVDAVAKVRKNVAEL